MRLAERPRSAEPAVAALTIAAVAGLLHAAISVYWGLGGTWLIETLGERIVDTFADARWLLLVVAAAKAVGAFAPLWLQRTGRLGRRPWSLLAGVVAAVLIGWGGLNAVVGNLVLLGVVQPDGGYDRPAMIGHAWLWDPLFLLWGVALLTGVARATRSRYAGRSFGGVPTSTG